VKLQNERTPLQKEILGQTKINEGNPFPKEHGPVQEENQQDRKFLFATFHEMRNPLHAIMGYTSLVLRKTRDQIPEKHQENLGKIILSAERLKEIVDRMVAFYREK
jgi:signal transduction histidine kinase